MYYACLMAAFRFHAIVKHILMRTVSRRCRHKRINARFLAHVVIKDCCTKMVGHVSTVRRRRKDVKICITSSETAWVCYEAFHRKLSRHAAFYADILPAVNQLRTEYEKKFSEEKLKRLRSCIGRRIPRPFRRMKDNWRK